jgi:hypothetical protein
MKPAQDARKPWQMGGSRPECGHEISVGELLRALRAFSPLPLALLQQAAHHHFEALEKLG